MRTLPVVLRFLLLLSTGVCSGALLIAWYAVQHAKAPLSGPDLTRFNQIMLQRVVPVFVVLFITSIASASVLLWRSWGEPGLGSTFTAGGLFFVVAALVVTLTLNVPINNQFTAMSPDNPLPNWHELQEKWELYDAIRTWLVSIGFVLHAVAAALTGTLGNGPP